SQHFRCERVKSLGGSLDPCRVYHFTPQTYSEYVIQQHRNVTLSEGIFFSLFITHSNPIQSGIPRFCRSRFERKTQNFEERFHYNLANSTLPVPFRYKSMCNAQVKYIICVLHIYLNLPRINPLDTECTFIRFAYNGNQM